MYTLENGNKYACISENVCLMASILLRKHHYPDLTTGKGPKLRGVLDILETQEVKFKTLNK